MSLESVINVDILRLVSPFPVSLRYSALLAMFVVMHVNHLVLAEGSMSCDIVKNGTRSSPII